MNLVKDKGFQYYKIRDRGSLPLDWVNSADLLKGFPCTSDLTGFRFPSPNPVPILVSPERVCYLFTDQGEFYFWWPITGTLERIDAPRDIEGILDRLRTGKPCEVRMVI